MGGKKRQRRVVLQCVTERSIGEIEETKERQESKEKEEDAGWKNQSDDGF